MAEAVHLFDGYGVAPGEIGRPIFEYPFAMNGDILSTSLTRTYKQRPQYYARTPLGTPDQQYGNMYLINEGVPQFTPTGMFLFQRRYSKIPSTQTVPTSRVITRPALSGTFPQVYGAYRLFQPDSTLVQFDAYYAQTVISDSGAPGFYPTGGTWTLTFGANTTAAIAYNASAATAETAIDLLASMIAYGGCAVTGTYNTADGLLVTLTTYATATCDLTNLTVSGAGKDDNVSSTNGGFAQVVNIYAYSPPGSTITGGTFTITMFGQTTAAIAYNATAAQVEAALELLSEVAARGGCTVSVPSGYTTILKSGSAQIDFSVLFALPTVTGSGASLTPASTLTIETGGGTLTLNQFRIHLAANAAERAITTAAAHGITTSDTIYIKGTTYYGAIAGNFTVPNTTTIILTVTPAAAYASSSTITEVGKRTKATYKPGTAPTRANEVTSFYLPGVTAGIITAADITIPTLQSDDASMLQAIFAGTGTINYVVGDLTQWMDSTMLSLTKITVSSADL